MGHVGGGSCRGGGGVCHAGVGWVMENSNLRIFGKSLTFQLNKLYTQSM